MGKTRTTVGTSISRAFDDTLVPNAIKTAIENSVIKNTELTEYMVAGLADSVAARAHRMHDFAKRGHYTHGLPSGAFYTPAETGEAEVLAVLRQIEGAAVDIQLEYLHYGAPNNLHYAWTQVIEQYGYNTETNELPVLSALKGSTVYLEDLVNVVPTVVATQVDTDSLEHWGVPPRAGVTPDRPATTKSARMYLTHSPVEVVAGGEEHVRLTYVWGPAGNVQRESVQIPVSGLSDRAKFFHAAYLADGYLKYFFYEDGLGTWVLLDAVFDAPPTPNGSFFPFIYFRYEKVSELNDKTTESYKTNKKLMKILGMEYDAVAEAINANPDIADVEQAMLMMAVPANTTNRVERRYLWDFFNNLFLTQAPELQKTTESSDMIQRLIDRVSGFNNPGIAIQDSRFKMWIDNEGIYKRRVAGKIGKVGSYSSGYQKTPKTVQGIDPLTGNAFTLSTDKAYHYYQKQVSAGFYDEIQVIGMKTVFNIYGSYNSIGDEEDPILLIPVDKSITVRYPMPQREELYARSMHYVFNSRVTQKVKWYQTSLFRAILIIVMIVITVLTNGATAKELYALIAAGAYTAAAYLILVKILAAVLIRAIFKVLVRALGAEAAFVIAILAAVAGVVDAIDSGSLSGAPFAKDLLALASGMTQAIGDVMGDAFSDLAGEYEALEDWKKVQDEVLKAGRELLGEETRLNPFVIFGETPQEYYGRTVHSGNIGVASIEAVTEFVSTKLQLPKLQDTIEGVTNE